MARRQSVPSEQAEQDPATEKVAAGMERSFAVLELIADKPRRVVDVTKALGVPWATVHRTIKKLEAAQFIRRDPSSNHYEIGPSMWHLGSAYLANNKPLNAAIAYLAREHNIEHVDIQIVERMGNYSVVTHAEKRQTQHISKAQYGFHIPLHAGSKGWVLLANEDDAFIDAYLAQELEALTAHTITDPDALRIQLAKVREAGVAQTLGDVQPFTGSVAAPIFNANAQVIACVCFVFLKTIANNADRMDQILENLMLMSHTISMDLGWGPGLG